MKANVPEKIYISPNTEESTYYISNQYKRLIEYTHTDAFIKKACEWLFNRANIYTKLTVDSHDGSVYSGFYSDKMVEDFKKAMEM